MFSEPVQIAIVAAVGLAVQTALGILVMIIKEYFDRARAEAAIALASQVEKTLIKETAAQNKKLDAAAVEVSQVKKTLVKETAAQNEKLDAVAEKLDAVNATVAEVHKASNGVKTDKQSGGA